MDYKIIAHRGIFDNEKVIENTIPSFKKAFQLEYPVELDVQLTKDSEIVVFHDEDLTRLAGNCGIIQKMDYAEIKKFPLRGTKSYVPLLSEVLQLNRDRYLIDIEIKPTKKIDETIYFLMKELEGYHNFLIKSFDPRIVRRVKEIHPEIRVGLLIHDHYKNPFYQFLFHTSLILKYAKVDFVSISKKLLKNPRIMKKYLQYPVFVWTIKTPEEMDEKGHLVYICNQLPYKKTKVR